MDLEGKQSVRMVLHNLELLERILQYLSECGKTLISASLTAKAFSEPAFNVLWYEIHSIWPLIRMLPTFERGADGYYLFTGPIRNEHLQRVFYYAKRIRFLHYEDTDVVLYSNAPQDLLVSTLMRLEKLGAFIPLRKVRLSGPLDDTMLLPLTSPNLDNVEISTKVILPELTEIEVASFLQSVASQSPLLKSLSIEGPLRAITLQVLPDFTKLERLTLRLQSSDIPVHFLKRLASSMPSLRYLHIKAADPRSPPPNYTLGQPHSICRTSFPSLETLKVGSDSTHLESFLGILDAPLLRVVSLVLLQSTPNASTDVDKFVERNGAVLKDKIHRLIIKSVVNPSLSFVKSLEKLRELIVVCSLGTISMSDIVDTFIYDGFWSHSLTHLRLKQTNPKNTFDCMSIAALDFVAGACPQLKSLEISIHRPDEPEKQIVMKKDGQERKPHDLENLILLNLPGVWNDTMPLAIEFVSLLDHLFPSMGVPNYTGSQKDKPGAVATREAWWKGVQDMWRMCQTIKDRKNEKQPLSVSV